MGADPALPPGVRVVRGAFADTRRWRAWCDARFAVVDPVARPWYTGPFGRRCQNRRDALHFAAPTPEGAWPTYRTDKDAKGDDPTARVPRSLEAAQVPERADATLRALGDAVTCALGLPHPPNHWVMHRFLDGTDCIGPHHDKWVDMQPESHIVSVSFGESRAFQLLTPAGKVTHTITLHDGDAVVLDQTANRALKHAVPRRTRVRGVRYSATMRCMDTFVDRSTRTYRARVHARAVPY